MFTLIATFIVIALFYSMVGFGGGSSYIAVLAAADVPYTLIPKVSLLCNLLVVSGGTYHYIRSGHFSAKLALPFVLSSVPLAFIGGLLPINEKSFFILLTFVLIACGLRLLFIRDREESEITEPSFGISLIVGGGLGLLAGMVGIGGGIFLSPLLIYMGWARSKNAAAVASAFIFLNSLAGLAGQLYKNSDTSGIIEYAPLFAAVIIGGQIGSRIGTHRAVSFALIQKGTGVLTLFISLKLLLKVLEV